MEKLANCKQILCGIHGWCVIPDFVVAINTSGNNLSRYISFPLIQMIVLVLKVFVSCISWSNSFIRTKESNYTIERTSSNHISKNTTHDFRNLFCDSLIRSLNGIKYVFFPQMYFFLKFLRVFKFSPYFMTSFFDATWITYDRKAKWNAQLKWAWAPLLGPSHAIRLHNN